MVGDLKTVSLWTLAVVAVVAIIAGVRGHLEARAWQERVKVAQESAAAQIERSRFLAKEAERWEARAQELVVVAGGLRQQVDSLATTLRADAQPLQERRDFLPPPPEALRDHPAINERDDLIDDLFAQTEAWEGAYARLNVAYDTLKLAYDFSMSRGDSLRAALYAATAAADSLNAVLDDRPGQSPWWKPVVTVGPSVGLAPSGTAYAGVGVTLGWRIPTP